MAAISGQPAPKPSQITSPVPSDSLEAEFDAALSEGSASLPPQTTTDPLEAQFDQALAGGVSEEPLPPPQEFAEEPGFAQANIEQFGNIVTRIQAGLAANDQEKLNFLRSKYGPENALMRDGKLYFRKSPKDKLKKLDPDTLELINDILPDFSREIVTEAAMLPGEALGAAAGARAGGGKGALIGAAAGRVLSTPAANEFANRVAEYAGVPQDEARSQMTENIVGMGTEAVAPVAGKYIKKMLPGTLAYKAAKEAGEREIVALSKQSQEVARAVELLKAEGRAAKVDGSLVGLPGSEVNLMGHQLHPDSPILLRAAARASNDPRFINAQNQLADDWGAALKGTLEEIGRRGNPGPYRPEVLADRVTNAVFDLEKAEGQAIGRYRAQAMANLKNAKQPLPPQVAQKTQELMNELGFKIQARGETMSIQPPADMRSLVGKLGLTSVGEARALVNNVNELAQGMKGGFSVKDIDRLRNSLGAASDSLFRTPAGAKLGSLSGDMRQLYRRTIEKGLPDDFERAAFNSAMDDFGQLKTNIGVLKSALNEDASAKAIVRSFFTGKDNLQKIKSIKQISPESFSALKEEWINQMMIDYGSRESKTGFKSGAFLDSLEKKYGDEFLREVLNDGKGPNLETVKNIAKVTERIELMSRGTKPDQMSEAQKKAIADAGIGLFASIKFKAVNGITNLMTRGGKSDSALMDILTRDGIDKYVANYSGKIDKKGMVKKLADSLAEYKMYKQSIRSLDSGAAGRATKRAVVSGAQEGTSNLISPVEESE